MWIRPLTLPQMQNIYRTHLIHDFPPQEVKPFSHIVQMHERGIYRGFGLFSEENRLFAYAYFCQAPQENCLLLDYFAVCADVRGQGYGTLFLQKLQTHSAIAGYDALFAEVEDPEAAKDTAQRQLRLRRISFYEQCAMVDTGIRAQIYSVDYRILSFSLAAPDLHAFARLDAIYHAMFPPAVYEAHVKWL